eukprot:TRINITY_DN116846_c0_g1_i1.p1 TRINITY_DN116846_c0_g1~~TRINITY_DN116846_c0_g1_i1.p1  ORF type:complete len:111 (-),score=15.35 TRINITY_DN116846_c0_g1_i1:71-403(-)
MKFFSERFSFSFFSFRSKTQTEVVQFHPVVVATAKDDNAVVSDNRHAPQVVEERVDHVIFVDSEDSEDSQDTGPFAPEEYDSNGDADYASRKSKCLGTRACPQSHNQGQF